MAVEAGSGNHRVSVVVGETVASAELDVPLEAGQTRIGRITVAQRANARPYTAADVAALHAAAAAVARAIHDAAPAFRLERHPGELDGTRVTGAGTVTAAMS